MTDFPDVENNPGVEVWKEDESWCRERVQTGVFKTCRTMRYSEEQRRDWEAIFNFHTCYKTSDSVPTMPSTFNSTSGGEPRHIDGAPLPWAKMWDVLRRRPRPHHRRCIHSDYSDEAAANESGAEESEEGERSECVPLAISNNVTGIGRPKGDRRKALKVVREHATVDQMGLSLSIPELQERIEEGTRLFFIKLGHFEGEFKVGLCLIDSLDDYGAVKVSWYERFKWQKQRTWPANPRFVPFKKAGRFCTTVEDVDVILPVPVLTVPSSKLPSGSSIAKSHIKLTKRCVEQLRDFCKSRREDLIKECGQASAREESAGEESAGEESTGEESAGEESAGEVSADEESAGEESGSESESRSHAQPQAQQEGGEVVEDSGGTEHGGVQPSPRMSDKPVAHRLRPKRAAMPPRVASPRPARKCASRSDACPSKKIRER